VSQAACDFIPLARLKGSSRPSHLIVLKGFFDGSERDGIVVLAGYIADDGFWPEMESAWARVLDGGPPMHATDAYNCQGDYEGWNLKDAHARIDECVALLHRLDRERFRAYSCVVPFHDFLRAAQQHPERFRDKSVRAFCVDHCVGPMFRHVGFDPGNPDKYLKQIFFDQNERFLHWMNRVYTAPRKRRPWWAYFCAGITPADSRLFLPLQASDVLAWVVGRCYTHGELQVQDWREALVSGYGPSAHVVYDYASLLAADWF
jgi:hypothetical protein